MIMKCRIDSDQLEVRWQNSNSYISTDIMFMATNFMCDISQQVEI